MSELFLKNLSEVFNFCIYYDQLKRPIGSGSARARIAKQYLIILKDTLLKDLAQYNFPSLVASISQGSGNFPRVPWISFHIKGRSVSNSLSVVICFAKDGRGVVAGLMCPTKSMSKLPLIKRLKVKSSVMNYLDVDGSPRTAYNNKFINPKEFYKDQIHPEDLTSHLYDSLISMYKSL